MRLGTKIKIVADHPRKGQDSLDDCIGCICEVVEHWKQKDSDLENGDIQVTSDSTGIIILNSREYVEI